MSAPISSFTGAHIWFCPIGMTAIKQDKTRCPELHPTGFRLQLSKLGQKGPHHRLVQEFLPPGRPLYTSGRVKEGLVQLLIDLSIRASENGVKGHIRRSNDIHKSHCVVLQVAAQLENAFSHKVLGLLPRAVATWFKI